MTDPSPSLPTHIENRLSEAVHSAFHVLLGSRNSSESIHQATHAVYKVVQTSLAHFTRTINDTLCVNKLPRELFVAILSSLPLLDRISASHVCQQWRIVALQTPDLWSTYKGFSKLDGSCDAAAEVLSRTGCAPLSLEMTVWNSGEALASLIRTHLHHIRSLTVLASTSSDDMIRLHLPLLYAIRDPAPALEQIDIRFSRARGTSAESLPELFPDVFANSAPLLRSAGISGVSTGAHPYPALSSLRSLVLAVDTVDVAALLHQYPLLEELALHAKEYTQTPATARADKHRLRLLQINGGTSSVQRVHEQVCGVRPMTFYVHPQREGVLHWLLSRAAYPSTARFYSNFPEMQRAVELGWSDGETWLLNLMSARTIQSAVLENALLFARLTAVTLHEHMWPDTHALPPGPALRELTLILGDAAPSHEGLSIFCRSLDRSLAAHLPSLATLCLATKRGAAAMRVSPHDVAILLVWHLAFDCTRLPRLVLRGVHLYDALCGGEMQELTALVDEISWSADWDVDASTVPQMHVRDPWLNWLYAFKD